MTDLDAPPRSRSMPFDKPGEGWTVRAGLPTGDVSYDDSINPEFYADELEAVFRRSWLHVGRTVQIPNPGDYFTREIPGLDVSILVSRGRDGEVRAFYNMCTHRGNKLVWEDHPRKEVCGNGRRFVCKYHGWQFDPEGQLRLVNKADWFRDDLDKADYGLVPVACDVWEGFIFVNFSPRPAETLREQLGDFADGLSGYPFDELTETFTFTCDAKANWKIFLDAMVEQYHGNTLHYRLIDHTARSPLRGATGSHFEIFGRNAIWSVAVAAGSTDISFRPTRPMEDLFRSDLWGPIDGPDIGVRELPDLVNISRNQGWTNDMFCIYPNMNMLVWKRGWVMVYSTWPIAVDRVLFEARMYFPKPRTASDRLAQELTAVEFKEFLLQDANLLECAQSMLAMRVKDNFPLADEEVVVRHIHQTSRDVVAEYRRERDAARTRA
ncbi:MAG TPA: aromatic ring-hydroxylating dioxygenase subunit alpha [Acidimicrobiales bacterium]|jgi:phenylpropionate dioxygenase-like ring-hydroxylating dioxygenase large terminal subunit|nr:aromatic ring-hydroxylating dioxygenase subunit alpha [Acidimicrobiales bacterium]